MLFSSALELWWFWLSPSLSRLLGRQTVSICVWTSTTHRPTNTIYNVGHNVVMATRNHVYAANRHGPDRVGPSAHPFGPPVWNFHPRPYAICMDYGSRTNIRVRRSRGVIGYAHDPSSLSSVRSAPPPAAAAAAVQQLAHFLRPYAHTNTRTHARTHASRTTPRGLVLTVTCIHIYYRPVSRPSGTCTA